MRSRSCSKTTTSHRPTRKRSSATTPRSSIICRCRHGHSAMECRVAVITEFERPLEIWTVPIPELEPGGVLVKVDAATLCGTDAHRWAKHIPVDLPFVPGHET